jgi:hypothetical protein
MEKETYPIPGIFWKVSIAKRCALACAFNPSSYMNRGSENERILRRLGTPTDIFFALEEKVYPVCDAESDTTYLQRRGKRDLGQRY